GVVRTGNLTAGGGARLEFPLSAGLGGFPGCRQRFVQGAPLLAGEVIALVVGNQIDNRTIGQGRRLVEN
ncbi:MAG: hypothetical protein DMG69_31710, partial [Acidobacteria bacterium]